MRLAVLDDDRALCADIAARLRRAGHGCFEFYSGETLRRALRRESFDLLVADWNVPDLSGAALLAWARANLPAPPPVVMLLDENAPPGTAAGADDRLIKPGDLGQIESRVMATLHRAYGGRALTARVETFGQHVFDQVAMTVTVADRPVTLTAKEFGLALLLFRNLGRPLSRGHIMESVWGRMPDVPTRTLDAHVSQVRKRLGLRPENGFRLSSVYGFGYLLERRDLDDAVTGIAS